MLDIVTAVAGIVVQIAVGIADYTDLRSQMVEMWCCPFGQIAAGLEHWVQNWR